MNHGDEVGADGVHLGVKFAAEHAVAEVDQAGAGISLDFLAGIFQRFQKNDAGRICEFLRLAVPDRTTR